MSKVEEYLQYISDFKNYSTNTIVNYRIDLDEFLSFLKSEGFADSIESLDRERVARNYLSYMSDHYTKKTIARKISCLNSYYKYLMNKKEISVNPFNFVKAPKVPKRLPLTVELNEIEMLYKSLGETPLDKRNGIILDFLFGLGIRVSELVNIQLNDLSINRQEALIHGKGSVDRVVPIPQKILPNLSNYLKYTRPLLLAKSLELNNKFLLINHLGTTLTVRGVRTILNELVKKAGETFKISPHMLRHSYASILLNNGADIRSVQELLGHVNLSTTQIYTHLTYDKIKDSFEKASPRGKNEKI